MKSKLREKGKANMQESANYQKMLEEVEGIVRSITSPDIDLDRMVNQVERGYELIRLMRLRLDETKTKIDQLHQRYESKES
ncbi:MAG: exodeoxyribonuclease VII small subunit [Proteobacteria bacterium]|nr:MAG: exodeoxyribonuclease VII small subunit [Pseudomonadota bacterium]